MGIKIMFTKYTREVHAYLDHELVVKIDSDPADRYTTPNVVIDQALLDRYNASVTELKRVSSIIANLQGI